MITSAIIPKPLARLPWRLIFLVTGIAGFMNSDGCSRMGPRSSQRCAPLLTKPSASTPISIMRVTP